AFAAMALLGFTVNLMTLFALILAIGIVVDDAIVIVENTSHYIEQGLSPKEAAIQAMGELTGPVLGITLVLTAVFLPASVLPGVTGRMFRQFALVIAAPALISALNALTLKPTQCALYLRPRARDRRVPWFYRGFNRLYGAVEHGYIGIVRWMVRRPWTMVCVFLVIVGLAGATFAVYPTALVPLEDQGYCIVTTQLPAGAAKPPHRQESAYIDPTRPSGVGGHRRRAQRYPRHQRLGHYRWLFRVGFSKACQRRYRVRYVSKLGPTPTRVFPGAVSPRAPA